MGLKVRSCIQLQHKNQQNKRGSIERSGVPAETGMQLTEHTSEQLKAVSDHILA